jgi:hypothetical protein
METNTRVWSELVLESRKEFGYAARRNRGRYAGQKVHVVITEYIVGVTDGYVPRPGTIAVEFVKTGKPVLFSARPLCGATQGQHAARPVATLTAADVTCTRCK